jgi:hypothetical protein
MSIETIFKNIELKKRIKFAKIKLNILRNSKNSLPEVFFESQKAIEPSKIEINYEASEIEYLKKFPHKLRYKYLSKYKENSIIQAHVLSAPSNINELNKIGYQKTNFTSRCNSCTRLTC